MQMIFVNRLLRYVDTQSLPDPEGNILTLRQLLPHSGVIELAFRRRTQKTLTLESSNGFHEFIVDRFRRARRD
jgi:hypothetical protein